MSMEFSSRDIQTGDVLTTNHPFRIDNPIRYTNAAVRLFTKSKWDHTAIAIRVWGRLYVAESLAKGISITPFEKWCKDHIVMVQRCKLKFNEKQLATIAMSKQGYVGYDFGGTFFFQAIYQITGRWMGPKSEKRAQKRLYCSEYVAWIYNMVLGLFPEYYKVAPDEIGKMTDKFDNLYEGPAKLLLT